MKRVLALVMAAMMCMPCASAKEMKVGSKGGSVMKVQEKLGQKGYLKDEADGVYGKGTAEAVKKFQQDSGLEPTGVADDATQEMLLSSEYASLREIQLKLHELGYLDIKSEDPDAATADALRRFQRDNGLTAGGKDDAQTRSALFDEENPPRSRTVHVQEKLIELGYLNGRADGDYGMMSREAMRLFQLANGLSGDGELTDESVELLLSGEVQGDETRAAQARLIALGYLNGKADGKFGPQSAAALKRFQEKHGLEATGELDDATREALFSEEAKRVYPTLNSESDGDAVRALQKKLIDYGFLASGADGDYGKKTYNAVLKFQQHLNRQGVELTADGEAGSETQEYLFGDHSTYVEDVLPGDESDEALRIERRLRALGYLDAEPDGVFDDYASRSLASFQTASGLESTGAADKAGVDALFSEDAQAAKHYVFRDVALGDEGGVVAQAWNALVRFGMLSGQPEAVFGDELEDALGALHAYLAANNPEFAELFAEQGKLTVRAQEALQGDDLIVFTGEIGAESDESEVRRLQNRLESLFYPIGNGGADGKFGEGTAEAVKLFQTESGLEPTGVADEKTQRALFSEDAAGNWTPYKLVVSLDDQRVYVYQLNDQKEYEHIKTFICSTGLEDATPRGVYSATTEPLDRWHYFVEYECWAQYAWRIIGNYYFHSILFDERDEDTIRWGSVYALGYKASHGCVRLEVESAKWIFQNCEAGTIVEIV